MSSIKHFHLTKRLTNILEKRGDEINIQALHSSNRLICLKSLANIYSFDSNIAYNESDFDNLYDIYYLLCIPDFKKSHSIERAKQATDFLNKINNNHDLIISYMSKFDKV